MERLSLRITASLFLLAFAAAVISCNSNDPNATRQQAQQATEQLKRDSREAAGNIKKGAETARTQLSAAAEGVKQGLDDKNSSKVDLNNADKAQLMGLQGIDENHANAIIADRPYSSAHDAVHKGAISEDQYRSIADHVSAGPTGK